MSIDTYGKIKGYVKYEDILEFIKNNYDKNPDASIEEHEYRELSKIDWDYKINEYSVGENWYSIYGFILNDPPKMVHRST